MGYQIFHGLWGRTLVCRNFGILIKIKQMIVYTFVGMFSGQVLITKAPKLWPPTDGNDSTVVHRLNQSKKLIVLTST